MRCYGKTRLCDWFYTTMGWATMDDIIANPSLDTTQKPEENK